MPVKIVSDTTSSEKGTITQTDLFNSLQSFKNFVSVTTISPHDTIIRTRSIWFKIEEVLKLIGFDEKDIPPMNLKYDGIRIYLSVHPDQDSCSGIDYRNHVSVVVLPTVFKEVDVVSEFALIPGFKAFPGSRLETDCCGNMKPPPSEQLFFK